MNTNSKVHTKTMCFMKQTHTNANNDLIAKIMHINFKKGNSTLKNAQAVEDNRFDIKWKKKKLHAL